MTELEVLQQISATLTDLTTTVADVRDICIVGFGLMFGYALWRILFAAKGNRNIW